MKITNRAFFTGHRNIIYPPINTIKAIEKMVYYAKNVGINHFYCGMAIGSDQLFARVLIDNGLLWTAVIPCRNQEKLWTRKQQKNYKHLLKFCQRKVVLYPEYSPGVFHARNAYMIKHSDICLAVYDGRKKGGTYETVKLAIACNLTIIQFNPLTNKITLIKSPIKQLSLF